MRPEEQIKEKYGTDPGYRVPDNYFEDLNKKIMSQLPPYQATERVVEMTLWQRMKPYVYLAAMFAGIWLMMNVFHRISSAESLNLDNPPAALAAALNVTYEEYVPYVVNGNDYALQQSVSESYDNIDDFEEDFGYSLKPEYANLNCE